MDAKIWAVVGLIAVLLLLLFLNFGKGLAINPPGNQTQNDTLNETLNDTLTDAECMAFCQLIGWDAGDTQIQGGGCQDDETLVQQCCCWNNVVEPPEDTCQTFCVGNGYERGGDIKIIGGDWDCYDHETRIGDCCCFSPEAPDPPEDCKYTCVVFGYEDGYGYSGSCGSGEYIVSNCCCKVDLSCHNNCASGDDYAVTIPFTGDNMACWNWVLDFCNYYGYRYAGAGYSTSEDCCCFTCYYPV